MPKYHIVKNRDFNNQLDNDDDSSTTNDNTTTEITLTNNETNFGLYEKSNSHNPSENNLLNLEDSKHYYQRHHGDDYNQKGHIQNHKNIHIEKLIQITNKNVIDNNNQYVHNKSNDTNYLPNFNTSSHNLITTFDSAIGTADAAEDLDMEVPLLKQNCNNNQIADSNNKHLYDLEYVCLCQQKGFAFNLNNRATRSAKSKILWAIALCCIFMVVEFLGGYIAGSLAIMTDAAHLASDCISFVIGLVAIWLGSKPPNEKMSFGYKRFEVMGAIASILGIWILTATLVLVAIKRIYSNDYDLNANTMMTISGIGILINIIMISILHTSVLDIPTGGIGSSHGHSHSENNNSRHGHSHSHNTSSIYRRRSNDSDHLHAATDSNIVADVCTAIDTGETTSTLTSAPMVLNENLLKHHHEGNDKNLNLRAAMIHVIGDLVQSFGVFFAAIIIKFYPKAVFLDPLCTLLFSVIVILTTINLFRESMRLIMDSVPQGLSLDDLRMDLLNIEGVKSVHHLNVWNHTSNYSILMVHLVIDMLTDSNTVLVKSTHLAGSAKYNIKHSTIQIERVTS